MKKLSLLFALILSNPILAQVQLGGDIEGEAPFDHLGKAVSINDDGTIIAIGIPQSAVYPDSGMVKVFSYINSNWTQLGSDIVGEAEYDLSGCSVSLSSDGTVVAIGASGNDGNGIGAGHVRVYEYSSGSWTQLGADIDGEEAGDASGYSVSLSSDGTTVAIGAPQNLAGDTINYWPYGHVRVFEYINGSWTQIGTDIDGEGPDDLSGSSVSLSSDGTIVAIGAFSNDGNDTTINSNRGHVRVYKYLNSSWTQLGVDIDGEAAGDYSGSSVSLSSDGNIVAIGAPYNIGNGNYPGHVRVYEYIAGSWTQLGGDIDGEAGGDESGFSVSLSSDGTVVAIGAISNDGDTTYTDADFGHVRIYEYVNGSWTQLGGDIDYIDKEDDLFGHSVNLSSDGTTVVVGAPNRYGSWGVYTGLVRIYSVGGNTAGINPTTLDYNLQIYPNPTNDYLILDIPEEMIDQQYSFVITNAAGQSMYSDFLNQKQLQINLKNFASSGTHTLQIKDSGGNVVDTRVIILQ